MMILHIQKYFAWKLPNEEHEKFCRCDVDSRYFRSQRYKWPQSTWIIFHLVFLCDLNWLVTCVVWYSTIMFHIKPYRVSCQQQLLVFSPSAELVFQRLQTRVQVDTRNWKAFCFYLLGFWTLIMPFGGWKYSSSTLCGTKPRILSKTLSGRVCIGQTWGKSQI